MALTSKVRLYKLKLGAANAPGIYRAGSPYCYLCPWNKNLSGVWCLVRQ